MDSYFAYMGDKLNLRPYCRFDTVVKQAHWDDQMHLWNVTAEGKDGPYKAVARYLILCTVRELNIFVFLGSMIGSSRVPHQSPTSPSSKGAIRSKGRVFIQAGGQKMASRRPESESESSVPVRAASK